MMSQPQPELAGQVWKDTPSSYAWASLGRTALPCWQTPVYLFNSSFDVPSSNKPSLLSPRVPSG